MQGKAMTTQTEALKLALEALEGCLPYVQEQRGDMKTYNTELTADNAITAIKEALAQPEQEKSCQTCVHKDVPIPQAVCRSCRWHSHYVAATLAQPEQEPVAWMIWTHGPVLVFMKKDEADMEFDRLNQAYPEPTRMLVPLYTTAQQRTWVGLTDEEIKHIYICTTGWSISDSDPMLIDFAEAIEAKLKEKNTK